MGPLDWLRKLEEQGVSTGSTPQTSEIGIDQLLNLDSLKILDPAERVRIDRAKQYLTAAGEEGKHSQAARETLLNAHERITKAASNIVQANEGSTPLNKGFSTVQADKDAMKKGYTWPVD